MYKSKINLEIMLAKICTGNYTGVFNPLCRSSIRESPMTTLYHMRIIYYNLNLLKSMSKIEIKII